MKVNPFNRRPCPFATLSNYVVWHDDYESIRAKLNEDERRALQARLTKAIIRSCHSAMKEEIARLRGRK